MAAFGTTILCNAKIDTSTADWGKDDLNWRCTIFLADQSTDEYQHRPCSADFWAQTPANWNAKQVDANLQISLRGGPDIGGVFWEGGRKGETFSETLNRQFRDVAGQKCEVARVDACQAPTLCTSVGSFSALALGSDNTPMNLGWVYLALSALGHINQQLSNQYDELSNAIESLSLNAFSIDDFFPPKESQGFGLLDGLAGLSGILTILGGFVPVVGPAVEAVGTIASGVGTFLANSVSTDDSKEPEKLFADQVRRYYGDLLSGMENIITQLLAGEQISFTKHRAGFNITDMMRGGAWVDPDTITPLSDLNKKLRVEILARTIDSLWKTPTKNKVWVLFTDLGDGKDKIKCQEGKPYRLTQAPYLRTYHTEVSVADPGICALRTLRERAVLKISLAHRLDLTDALHAHRSQWTSGLKVLR